MTRITPAIARVALPWLREITGDMTPNHPDYGAVLHVQIELEEITRDQPIDFGELDKIMDAAFPAAKRDIHNEWNDGTFRRYRPGGYTIDIGEDGAVSIERYLTTGIYTDTHRRVVRALMDEIDRQWGWAA